MASTRTLQDSINWATPLLGSQPFNVSNMEPGLHMANLVKQKALGPPMRWRQNRGNLTFAISQAGGTDYSVVVTDLGWIEPEAMWLLDGSGNKNALEGAEALAGTTIASRPQKMSPIYDDNAGGVTFRMNALPDANYTVFADYQRKASPMLSYGSTWDPLPDEYSYIYDQMFLALMGSLTRDVRAPYWGQQAVSALLGAQKGLTAQAVAIFLGEWDRAMQSLATSQEMGKMGVAGLGR